jgi:hypothetical protein
MTDPQRLFDSSDDELERILLRAGRERAPRGAKRRALAAASGVIAASTLTTGNATGAALAGKAAASAKAATLVSLKWIVVVSVASLGVAAGTVAVKASRAGRPGATAVAIAASAPARPRGADVHAPPRPLALPVAPPTAETEAAESEAAETEAAETEVSHAVGVSTPAGVPGAVVSPPLPTPAVARPVTETAPAAAPAMVPVAPPARAAAGAPATASGASTSPHSVAARTTAPSTMPSAGSSSAAELAMLDQARAAIDHGDAGRGLSLLDAYASRFPRGVMGPEASILRIEALANKGDRAAASREGEAFLRANPTSPYAARIASLLGTSNP